MQTKRSYPALLPPMLAPNKLLGMDIDIQPELFPCLVSIKYNGIRGLALDGTWVSRSGKPLALHPILARQFSEILNYAKRERLVLDGEFHSNSCNTVGETRSILAGKLPTPVDFKFKCFYALPFSVWNGAIPATMEENLSFSINATRYYNVKQSLLNSPKEFQDLIEDQKHMNIEGFMLLQPTNTYKHGRVTQREATLLKYKYYTGEEDAKIIGLTPRKERRAGILSGQTPLGYAQQPYNQEAFVETDIAGCIIAQMETGDVIYVPFPVGWSLEDRRLAYINLRKGGEWDLLGQWITFRRLACESRDKPIAIKNVQLRDSKD